MIQKAAFLEAAVLNPSALLEFFLVDMTVLRGPVAYFHAGVYPPGHASQYGDIIWQGQPYAACPLMTEGFAFTTIGTQPTPTPTCRTKRGSSNRNWARTENRSAFSWPPRLTWTGSVCPTAR